MLNRRQFAISALAVSTTSVIGCKQRMQNTAGIISKVGIQTYTLRKIFEENPLETLEMIKRVGYDYVELNARNFEKTSPLELKSMLDRVGLKSPASHISLDMLKGDLKPLITTSKTLGFKYVVVPWINDDVRELKDWKTHAKLMNEVGRQLTDNGIRLAYHNHQFEFVDLGGGTTAMEILLNDSDPENLDFELDLFWAYLADADILGLFKSNPGRFKLCHIKDMGANKADFATASYDQISSNLMKNVGEGIIPFESYFKHNAMSGMRYFIAEHDNPKLPYDVSISTSLKNIKNFKF